MKEKILEKKVDRYLKSLNDCYFVNIHGNGIQRAGVPDRLICYKGFFIGLELKRPDGKGKESNRQKIEGNKIINAGGIYACIDCLSDLNDIIWSINATDNDFQMLK